MKFEVDEPEPDGEAEAESRGQLEEVQQGELALTGLGLRSQQPKLVPGLPFEG